MYEQINGMTLEEKTETLTRFLVSIKSLNGTSGERDIADHISQILKSFPYFRKHPERVWEQPIPGDPLGRKNVFALVTGNHRSEKPLYIMHI